MNFFQRQAQARRSSRWLVLAFLLAVAGVIVAVDVVAVTVFAIAAGDTTSDDFIIGALAVIMATTVLTFLIIVIASLVKLIGLRSGGGAVARAMGAMPVPGDSRDFQLRRLRNVVEEMAIASGVPVPEIYVLEKESAINAFAAGWSPSDAAIAVTRGALDQLKRDELQGVIAHEYSHILNGDMRLNLRLIGLLFGLLVIAVLGQKVMRGAVEADDGRAVAGGIAIGLSLFLIGYIGVFFGHLIKAAVSRDRERLADASAVQFTRQTSGLANALKKIAGLDAGSKLRTAEAENVSHMLFAEGLGSWVLATHPPIDERIRALDPSFDRAAYRRTHSIDGVEPEQGRLHDDAVVAGFAVAASGTAGVSAEQVVAQVGNPGVDHVRLASRLRATLPQAMLEAAQVPSEAPALVLALLIAPEGEVRERQLQALVGAWPGLVSQLTLQFADRVASLAPLQRMPLALLAMPALKRRPREELQRLRRSVHELIHADGQVQVFEYALGAMLETQLGDALKPAARQADPGLKLDQVRAELELLLAVFARIGHATEAEATRAFQRGLHALLPRVTAKYAVPANWPGRLDAALRRLDALLPQRKQMVLEGLAETLLHDRQVTADEFELLRAVCGSLHCPLPPLAIAA